MNLTEEERDIFAGRCGSVPQRALKHQMAVGAFFGASDFVPVTQAHIMADTESLGEAGVVWLEELATPTERLRRVRIATTTTPHGTLVANAESVRQTPPW